MTDLVLNPIQSGYNLSLINTNFTLVKNKINTDVIHASGGNNILAQDIDMGGNTLFNVVADPNVLSSVVTFQYINSITGDVQQALNDVEDAVNTANAASAAANAAVITANNASSVALGIDAKAQQALDNSNTAITTANNASVAVASKQPLDATLTGIAALTTAADQLVYSSGVDTFSTLTFPSYGRSLASSASASAARTTLQVESTPTFIDGLQLKWVSGTAVTITGGAAYIPSLARVLQVPSDIVKTGLSLTASTLYHAYLYLNGSTPDVEFVTTAPSAVYLGTARNKTGDTSRRYLGSFYTNASAAGISAFFHDIGSGFMQMADMTRERLRVLNNGTATTATSVSFSALVPVSSQRISCVVSNTAAATITAFVGNPDLGTVGNNAGGLYLLSFGSGTTRDVAMYSSTAQAISYCYSSSPSTNGLYFDLQGYYFNR